MSDSAALIDRAIAVALAPALKERRFRKHGRNFRRVTTACVQVVNVQGSVGNFSGSARFTVNLAAHFPDLASATNETSLGSRPAHYRCHLDRRIGTLMPSGQDHWWSISDEVDVLAVGRDAAGAVLAFGVPWLDSLSEFASAAEVVRGDGRFDLLTVLLVRAGDHEGAALALARSLQQRSTPQALRSWAETEGIRPKLLVT